MLLKPLAQVPLLGAPNISLSALLVFLTNTHPLVMADTITFLCERNCLLNTVRYILVCLCCIEEKCDLVDVCIIQGQQQRVKL